MSQPQWVTTAGHLATIPEGVFYQIQLAAVDPAHPLDPTAVNYRVIAGSLPLGIQCTSSGMLEGVPYVINGTSDVNSRFAIRASTNTIPPRFADRTFDFTVQSQVAPVFVTPAGNVGSFYDGAPITPIQIEISDHNPGDNVVISLAAGTLPPGLKLSPTGLISGYIEPLVPVDQVPGFDTTPFDQYAFDFAVNSLSTNYQFTLEVNDGKETSLRTFEIYVYSRSSLTADTTEFTADNTFITADETNLYTPFLIDAVTNSALVPLTADNTLFKADNTFITADQTEVYAPFIAGGYINNLGSVRSDNFWAYQFKGLDFDGDMIEYLTFPGAGLQLPPGTTLDSVTGWLYGYLPNLGVTQITFDFAVYVRKTYNPQYRSDPYYFSLTLVGAVNTDVTWLTPSNLGFIVNGSTSTLSVEAVNTLGGRPLQYRLAPGSYPTPNVGVYNKLPQGLEMLSSGDIAGRVSFNTFAIDLGTTTFDRGTTNFDSTFTFTVNAYSQDGVISVDRTFTVQVIREYNEPYENLYIKCMPPESSRVLINQLIQNQDIIPIGLLYRADDPNFGVANNVTYHHAYGLTAATYADYVSSLSINHYWKNLVLGSIKTAQALDDNGNILYEVVYSQVVDDLVNNAGSSVSKSVTLPYSVTLPDTTVVTTVYPNSLINMRDQVIDTVGQVSKMLPRWMLSKQANGQVLGFTPAWVIAYCLPGKAAQVAYNIAQQFGEKLNLIDFEVDRYELDRLLTKNWDPVGSSMVFDPAYTGNALVLSNQALTVTATSGIVGYPSSLATYAIVPGQKVMFSVTIDVWAPVADGTSVGIANHAANVETWLGSTGTDTIGFWDDGKVYINGTGTSGYSAFGYDGAVVDVAVDRSNNLIWMRVDGGLWNNSALASPAAATGGVDISFISGTVYPGVNPYYYSGTAGQMSINTSTAYSVPAGFNFIGAAQGAWVPTPAATTFDLLLHYEVSSIGNYYVSPYAIGDEILILGSQVGGQDGVNDITIKVQNINVSGGITGVAVRGQAPLGTLDNLFSGVAGTNVIGTGSGGIFDILVGSGVATTFDAGSIVFEAPVDMYSSTDSYDRYLVFPRRTILSPVM